MARTDNLQEFLTDIADSIRTKKEYSEDVKITASEFDTEIASIETGTKLPDGIFIQEDLPTKTTEEAFWLQEIDTSNIKASSLIPPNLNVNPNYSNKTWSQYLQALTDSGYLDEWNSYTHHVIGPGWDVGVYRSLR